MSTVALSIGVALAAVVAAAVGLAIEALPDTLQKARAWWRESVYPRLLSVHTELRRLPETEEERLRALELTLGGISVCIVGALFPLVLPIGAIMFYFGARKISSVFLRIRTKNDSGRADVASQI